ncbi:EF-hand domain-containing protein [Pseudoxanthomonas winnipegensis]|uniref:Calcium-binding protein n=1 Tax=Pseudoxanthomonas winnipegensis TaxID=2480810 RepID=A0A4Q8LLT6_9GAMM|nr:EF-hand domain-containing protein [Pseudoxanthomonas winnipegensis]RZZ86396.1 calcium-binding protein [Pseudoxanthomonas winnipegensis]TAA31534.1 calcium-binding protein [Pseudoxanthomonas winnipegensis]TAA41413.1 calcium-binding protein [Pseudoxanthomonas winnipegensis]TBV77329.1 calcium-binding protein [Pseudoxanthomonas winnipegensis]
MRKTLIAFSIVAALGAGTAWAAGQDAGTPPPPPPPSPKALDTNQDGKISRAEAAANPWLAKQFDALDKNKDGFLSRDELPRPPRGERGHGPGPDGWLSRLDTNHDGRISAAEAKADPKFAARFAEMDVNKDGFVDKADFEQKVKQRRDEWFAKADTNKDGLLSKAEFDAAKPDRPMHGPGDERGPRGHRGGPDGVPPPPPPPADAPAKS